VLEVAMSDDGRFIATACSDRSARVWDAATGDPITPPLPHRKEVDQVGFLPGRRVFTVSRDGVAQVWDLPEERRPLIELTRLATVLAGRRLNQGVA
jgi:WD40 repeat protein